MGPVVRFQTQSAECGQRACCTGTLILLPNACGNSPNGLGTSRSPEPAWRWSSEAPVGDGAAAQRLRCRGPSGTLAASHDERRESKAVVSNGPHSARGDAGLLLAGGAFQLPQLRRRPLRLGECDGFPGSVVGRVSMGLREFGVLQLASANLAVAQSGLPALRAGCRRPSCDEPPVSRGQRGAALRRLEADDGRSLAERLCRRALWVASDARRIGGVGRRAQGCALRLLLLLTVWAYVRYAEGRGRRQKPE